MTLSSEFLYDHLCEDRACIQFTSDCLSLSSTFHFISSMAKNCIYTYIMLSEVNALYKHWLLEQQWA